MMQRQKRLIREAGRVVGWTYTLYNMVPHGHKDEDRFIHANIKAQARYARRVWASRRMQEGAKS